MNIAVSETAREARARRRATREGLGLTKDRASGTYLLFDPYFNTVVVGPDLSLEEIEHALYECGDGCQQH